MQNFQSSLWLYLYLYLITYKFMCLYSVTYKFYHEDEHVLYIFVLELKILNIQKVLTKYTTTSYFLTKNPKV